MKWVRLLCAVVACQALIVESVNADVIFTVVGSPVTAGNSGSVTIFASSNSGGEALSGFNLPFDVGGNGVPGIGPGFGGNGLGPDISLNASLVQNEYDGDAVNRTGAMVANLAPSSFTGADFQIDFTPSVAQIVNLTGTAIPLFDLVFDVGAGAGTGPVPVSLLTGTNFNVGPGAYGGTPGAAVTGNLAVTAVPEPGSATLIALAFGATSLVRRRRR